MKCIQEKTGETIEEGTELQSVGGKWHIVETVWEPGTWNAKQDGRIQTVDGGVYSLSVFGAKFVD